MAAAPSLLDQLGGIWEIILAAGVLQTARLVPPGGRATAAQRLRRLRIACLPAGLLRVSASVRRRPRKDQASVTQLVTRPGLLRLRTPPFA